MKCAVNEVNMEKNCYEKMREAFVRLMEEYADVYETVRAEKDWKNPFRDVIAKDIPDLLKECAGIDAPYKVVGSYGKGLWTAVPWIAVFDSRITTSAQKGVYIVYLLNKDSKELYLAFETAATEVIGKAKDSNGNTVFSGIVGSKDPKMEQTLKKRAASIRKEIPSDYFEADDNIQTGSAGYDYGAVYYRKYTLESLPDGKELTNDLMKMIDVYREYYDTNKSLEDDPWWPSLEEYDPGIKKEQWIEMLNDGSTFTENALIAMAAIYDYGGTATCKQLEQKYGRTSDFYRATLGTQLASKVKLKLKLDYWKNGDKRHVWPIVFQGRDAKDEPGSYVWKIRPELWEALTEVDIKKYLTDSEGRKKTDVIEKDAIDNIKSYIASRGFSYNDGLIENFYLSLKCKPFVILAGTSGTGKTRLVKLFAEAIGAEYRMVSVRPDWSDGSDLFGYNDLNGNFISGPICSAFEAAAETPSKPVLLCLDEMNLARVEYYLSDILSVIESREKKAGGTIVTDAIAQYESGIPDNLYIVGTVNMDETTFPFSKKVLDRANTIEFNYVDLMPDFDAVSGDAEAMQLTNDFLCTEYLVLARDCADAKEYVVHVCDELGRMNEILKSANAHVGYRVRDEIVFYMLNNKKADNLISEDQAFDNEIMQKILPRIQGSSALIKDLLIELYKFCMKDYSALDTESGSVGAQMQEMADTARYSNSARKLGYMMMRYEEDGFTSYWL